jgi:curved DNA-binding protein CbpA
MESYRISYYGDVAQFHVRELLVSLAAQQETCVLLLKRASALKKIYFHCGKPIYAQSNLAREGVLRFLRDQGQLDVAALENWLRSRPADGPRRETYDFLKEAWSAAPERLRDLHRRWTAHMMLSAAHWMEGSFVVIFDEKPPASGVEFATPFEIDELIVDSVRQGMPKEFLRGYFKDRLDETPKLQGAADRLVERLRLNAVEAKIVGLLERNGPFKRVVLGSEAPSDRTFAVALILETLGLLEFPAKRRTSRAAGRMGDMTVDGLAFVQRLKEKGPALLKAPPFEMLDLHRFFDEEELRRGYYTLAQQYHPKEYVDLLPADLRELSYQIFERASDIFEALVVWEKKRLADDFASFRLLEAAGGDAAQPTDPGAELAFILGQSHAAAGNWLAAHAQFQAAVDIAGGQSEYRAWLAWSAMTIDDASPRTALGDLRKCVEDDPDSGEGRRLYARALERAGRRELAHVQYLAGAALAPHDREMADGRRRTAPRLSAGDLAAMDKERADDIEEERRMRETLQALNRADYFHVFGLERDAPITEVRKRYFEMAKRYHPDRYKNTRLLEVAEALFVLINEAYDTLTSEKKRAAYEAALASAATKQTYVERERKMAAERLLQKGQAYLQANNWAAAVDLFEELAREQSELAALGKAYYAWSLFNRDFRTHDDAFRRAERLALEALRENPNLAEAHVVIGKMHRRLNELPRAKQCFEKALELTPDHVEALRELRLLNQRVGGAAAETAGDDDKKRGRSSLFGRKKS